MRKYGKLLLAGLLILGLMVAMVGCGGADKSKQADTEKVYNVGSETTYPPFEMVEKGKYTGFDMELIQAIADAGGFKIKIVSLGFDGLIPALQAGNIDAAISAMTITDKRKEAVDFSNPYFDSGLIVAVRSDDTTIKSIDDLQGKVIAVQIGTTGANMAQTVKDKDPKTTIKTFNTVDLAFAEMANKGCDAVINDMPVTGDYISKGHPEAKMVGELLSGEQYGIPVKKGNKEMLAKINDGLAKVKESGKYDEIYKKYFGEMPQ
ncbi:MAG: basic amino acid ABC transporter substrate-binding protein [Ignavibacteriales bacterium]